MFRNIQGNKARKVDCCCVFSACILKPELGLLVNDFVFTVHSQARSGGLA